MRVSAFFWSTNIGAVDLLGLNFVQIKRFFVATLAMWHHHTT